MTSGIFYYNSYLNVKDFSEYLNGNAGFFVHIDYSTRCCLLYEDLFKWSYIESPDNYVRMSSKYENVIHTWDEAKSSASPSDGLYYYSASDKYGMYCNILIYKPGYSIFNNKISDLQLVSKCDRNILVFKSKEALENYSVDHRTFYFGSKFYENTGAWDDFQDWLDGKYDDLLDRLKDLIPGSSPSLRKTWKNSLISC